MSFFLVFIGVGLVVIRYYMRGFLGIAFAAVIAYRMKRSASVKSWVITIIIFIIALAVEDLAMEEKPGNLG